MKRDWGGSSQHQSDVAGHYKLDHFQNRYLRGTTVWVYEILTGHLDRLVGFGKLDGIYQPLMTRLTVGIRHTHQIGSLRGGENKNSRYQQ